jgi:hypothetical protein
MTLGMFRSPFTVQNKIELLCTVYCTVKNIGRAKFVLDRVGR